MSTYIIGADAAGELTLTCELCGAVIALPGPDPTMGDAEAAAADHEDTDAVHLVVLTARSVMSVAVVTALVRPGTPQAIAAVSRPFRAIITAALAGGGGE